MRISASTLSSCFVSQMTCPAVTVSWIHLDSYGLVAPFAVLVYLYSRCVPDILPPAAADGISARGRGGPAESRKAPPAKHGRRLSAQGMLLLFNFKNGTQQPRKQLWAFPHDDLHGASPFYVPFCGAVSSCARKNCFPAHRAYCIVYRSRQKCDTPQAQKGHAGTGLLFPCSRTAANHLSFLHCK